MFSRLPAVSIGVKLGGSEPLLARICLAFATAVLWSFSRAWCLRSRRDEPRPPRVFAAIGEMRGEQNQSEMADRLLGKLLIMGGRAMVQAYAKPSSEKLRETENGDKIVQLANGAPVDSHWRCRRAHEFVFSR